MIRIFPTDGDNGAWRLEQLGPDGGTATDAFISDNVRISELLGPDGEPLLIERARPRAGFDLSRWTRHDR